MVRSLEAGGDKGETGRHLPLRLRGGCGFVIRLLSCIVLSCVVVSCRVLSCLVLSCLVLACLVLSCFVLFLRIVLSSFVLFCLVLSLSLLSCLICVVLCCVVLCLSFWVALLTVLRSFLLLLGVEVGHFWSSWEPLGAILGCVLAILGGLGRSWGHPARTR